MENKVDVIGVALLVIVIGASIFFFNREIVSNTPSPAAVAVPFTELARGTESAIGRRVNYLIASQDQLRDLWKVIGAKGPLPDINFSESAVAAVFAGEKPTAGYGIAISSVKDADVRTVTVTLTEPGGDCVLAPVITSPYQVIKFTNTTRKLVHEDISTTAGCPE